MANRDAIADEVAAKLKMGKGDVRSIVAATIDEITAKLKAGEDVKLPGLGAFTVKETAARQQKNPITGAPMNIPAGRKVSFKAAADLKRGL